MSPPLLGVGEGDGQSQSQSQSQSKITALTSSNSVESTGLKERNYMGLSDRSAEDILGISSLSGHGKKPLNLKATELRLGLPGSQSPERDPDEKTLFPLHPFQKSVVTGNKRGFSNAMDSFSEPIIMPNVVHENVVAQPVMAKEAVTPPKMVQEKSVNETRPASKAQVVGWPPIRSFRKNSLAANTKNNDDVECQAGTGALYVKVSMDGAPFKRKIDLKTHSGYQDLSSTLEKKFTCFTLGQCGSKKEMLSESKLKDLLHGSEYVLTYEDKDGDWMLVGDVPWEMFIETCTKLRIMKGSDAIGLAPRAVEKCGNRN